MPTTFTHDLFGKEIYTQLPKNMQRIIKENKKQFLIGLHGPDIFFYHVPFIKNHVNQLGVRLHKEPANNIFERGIQLYQEQPSKALLAYLLGFACHYILDHTCHPYINKYEKEWGVSHSEIETHLDRYYMEENQKDPFAYKPAVSICVNSRGNKVICDLFPEISRKELSRALKGMRFYTGVVVCKEEYKRNAMFLLLRIVGCYDEMQGQIMKTENNILCAESTQHLVKLYEEAKEKALPMLKNLFLACTEDNILFVEYSFDFNS